MFGDINTTQLATDSFNMFKQQMDESYPKASLNNEALSVLEKENTFKEREAMLSQKANVGSRSLYAFDKPMDDTSRNLSWTSRNYNTAELYDTLSDGSLVKKFDTYTRGINNYENYAKSQGLGEKALRGFNNFMSTLATGVVGGTVGSVIGVGEAIRQGSFSALYDNDFMKELDLINERQLKSSQIFVSQEDKQGFLGKGFTNLFFDDILQGTAFTGGALLTEAIWATATGGGSLSTTGARLGLRLGNILSKTGRIADKAIDATQYVDDAVRLASQSKKALVAPTVNATTNALRGAKIADGLNLTRSVLTGAGYESGFEARAFMSEARRDFKQQFKDENGREPSATELNEFEDKLKNTANGLFAFNLAVVGASNMAQFGGLLGFKLPSTGLSTVVNRRLFGVGTRVVDDAVEMLKPSRLQKAGQIAWSLSKGAIIEGAFEEGVQGVGRRTADKYLERALDKNQAKQTYGDLVANTAKDLWSSTKEQYTSKEGLHEVFVGMIVGGLTGNIMGMVKAKGDFLTSEFANENKRNKLLEESFGKNSNYTSKVAVENLMMANRVSLAKKELEESSKNNDFTSAQQARATMLFAGFERANNLQYLEEHKNQLLNQIDLLDDNFIASEQGVPLESAKEIKETMKSELENQYKRYSRLSEFSKYMVGNKLELDGKKVDSKVIQNALTYELFLGENAFDHANEMRESFLAETEDSIGFKVKDIINKSSVKTQQELNKTQEELLKTKQSLEELDKEQRRLETTIQSVETPESRQSALETLNQLTQKRNELALKSQELTNKFNVLLKTDGMNIQDIRVSSVDDIIQMEEDIKNTLQTIENLKTTEPEKAERLLTYLKEYEKSLGAYRRYKDRTNQMLKMDLGKNNILGKVLSVFSKSKESTLDMVKSMMDTHFIEDKNKTLSDVFEEKVVKKKIEREEKPVGISIKDLIKFENESKVRELESKINELKSLTKEQKKDRLKKELDALSEDMLYITHITSENNAVNIFKSQLNMPAGIASTTGLVTKDKLFEILSDLIDGKSPHRGYLDMFIGAINQSELESQPGKTMQDKLENYLDENYLDDVSKTQLPSALNFAYFTDGILYTEENKLEEELSKEKAKKVESSSLSDYIQAIINENPYLLERVDPTTDDNVPTQEEMDEFVRLYSEDSSSERLQELNDKLVNWQFLETANYEGITLADLMKQRASLNTKVEKPTDEDIFTDADLEKVGDAEEKERNFSILQTAKDVFIIKDKNDIVISHMTPRKWLELQGQTSAEITKEGAKKSVKVTLDNINDLIEAGDIISYGNTNIKYVKGGRLVVPKTAFNLPYRKTASGFSLVFNADGTVMESDFKDSVEYSSDEIFKLTNGDPLLMVIDLEDDFNKSLEGKSEEEIRDNLKITFEVNGSKVGDLKANYGNDNPSPSFLALREKALDLFNNTPSKKATLGFAEVSTVFLGAPKININENNTFKVENPDLILDYGYWTGKKAILKSGENKGVRTELLKNIDKNVPIVVLKEGNQVFAYPANLVEVEGGFGKEIMDKGLSKSQLAVELNTKARSLGVKSELFYISDDNTNMFEADGKTSQELESVVLSLDALPQRVDYKEKWFEAEHDKQQLVKEIELTVNPESQMLTSPKIVINLDSISFTRQRETAEEMSKEIQKLFSLKDRLNKKVTKFAKPLEDNLYVFEGATFRFVELDGQVYSSSASNNTFKKIVDSYLDAYRRNPDSEETRQWAEKVRATKAIKGTAKEVFGEYEKYLSELQELENKINSDFLLKDEYEKLLTLSEEIQKESQENRKC